MNGHCSSGSSAESCGLNFNIFLLTFSKNARWGKPLKSYLTVPISEKDIVNTAGLFFLKILGMFLISVFF